MLSAENIFKASVEQIIESPTSSLVFVRLQNGCRMHALVSTPSAQELNLSAGKEVLLVCKASSINIAKNESAIKTSTANELAGIIVALEPGGTYALARMDCNGIEITASITMKSLLRMQLAVGDRISAQISSTQILIAAPRA